MSKIAPYAKAVYGAVVGALVAFLGALSTALAATGTDLSSLTDGQWLTAIVSGLGALPIVGGTIYATRNKKPVVEEPEDHFTTVEL